MKWSKYTVCMESQGFFCIKRKKVNADEELDAFLTALHNSVVENKY